MKPLNDNNDLKKIRPEYFHALETTACQDLSKVYAKG